MSPRGLALAFTTVCLAATADAQCPDGSRPDGRGACPQGRVAQVSRRPAPALDANTWIVVPFDNLAKATDAEWLRSASVNLLYLDMSRWKDIRVVDDERVADLLRETPEAAAASALSLNAGIAVAKRAGAGKLVMGDVLRLGNRTTVTAKVYDVKSGQRMRSVKEDALVQDSVMPLFGKLAQKILDVAPPPGANVGALGTSRTDAYQEYLAGIAALNTFDLRGARTRLAQALALDSTFALAHYKMSTLIGWDDPGNPAQRRHAEAAARYSAGLPPRVRSLITGLTHQAANEWTRSCEVYSALVKADSSDTEAWYGVGECLYHDPTMVAVGGDTNNVRFNADWQQSIHAFRRVLELDPQYHLAYQHIIDALTTQVHAALYCAPAMPASACIRYSAYVIRSGDTLLQTPVRATDLRALGQQAERYWDTRSRRLNLAAARAVAEEWVRNAPSQSWAQNALATVLAAEGSTQQAQVHLRNTSGAGSIFQEMRRLLLRMELAHKLGESAEAIRLYDSARTANGPFPGAPSGMRMGNVISAYGMAFGRTSEFDSLIARNIAQQGAPPIVLRFNRMGLPTYIGAPPHDSLAALERELFEFTRTNRGSIAATRAIMSTLQYALLVPRSTWPAIDTTIREIKLRPALALARGDTAGVRTAARSLDSLLRVIAASAGNDTGFTLVAAQAYLALRDTTAALRTVRYGLDTAMATAAFFPMQGGGFTAAYFVPRLALLRADLAAARGLKDEARVWYKRFIDAWSTAVPELQPLVARARKSYADVGGT